MVAQALGIHDQPKEAALVGEVVITRAKCGTRQAFHGSKWEIALEAEVRLK